MKTKAYILISSGARRLSFVLACLLIAGVGWRSKLAVDRLGQRFDELQMDFSHPSMVHLRSIPGQQKAPASRPNSPSKTAIPENLPESTALN